MTRVPQPVTPSPPGDLPPVCLAITPFERPDPTLLRALRRTRALAVLALGGDRDHAVRALNDAEPGGKAFGVVLPEALVDVELPPAVRWLVLERPRPLETLRSVNRRILVQVCTVEEARQAAAHGADGLIAKGNEAAGRVGEESTIVLLQRVLSAVQLPVWAQGGIGLHGAAAVLAAGAAGYVLDTQLALVREGSTSEELVTVLRSMDGSETKVVDGMRVLSRPGAPIRRPSSNTAIPAEREIRGVPIGQDGAFARPLAERYETAAAMIRGFARAAVGRVRLARRVRPFEPRGRFANEYRLRYPIVQGPMTRVSDTPKFARAVSDAGGLPFIALSLLQGEEARDLLEQTAAELGARSWGVGILGFVPDAIRSEQLELIRAQRPPLVLIAGGQPAQARELEDQGIETYLHVPSPGLLELFLREGARKFVFEGRECGGHVGPRASTVLWESALELLLAHERPEELSVVFAGGIHDARSAAMASVFAAPLAARGAKVAALMGTAYLFTREAVESGAIVPSFQQAALECTDTVLLETAPGHATRAVATEYVRHFAQVRRKLQEGGRPPQEIWAELEALNLGRLRIASKGLARRGDERVSVAAAEQQREGLYMIGQVATLRSEITTMERLHTEVSLHATKHWLDRPLPFETPRRAAATEIAIVGMACTFPSAPDVHAFFRNVLANADCISEIPAERWNTGTYFDAGGRPDSTPSKWGGFLPEQRFRPSEFGIPPRSLASIDSAQLLTLLVAKRALADAGLTPETIDGERTSVIIGAEAGTDLPAAYTLRAYHHQLFGKLPAELDELLPSFTEDSFPGVLSNVIAGRVTNRLDLGGLNCVVQAACASSLAALEAACKELAVGSSDVVVAGAADTHNSIVDYLMFASVHALSPTGRCRTFDASADGIVLGEGVAAIVLKRLEDARRDGDRVYAVIHGIAGSSDGRNLGLTAPRQQGQELALSRAYERAGVNAAEIGLLEAHGTGTVVGDRTELACLTEFMESSGAAPASCTLGSVKSQIGHTKCAAGMAGVIKLALSLYHGVLPPTRHIRSPNPFYNAAHSPFVFRSRSAPWLGAERRAGVSAFGFGGTNFHVVLGNADAEARQPIQTWPCELFVLRGPTREAALERGAQLAPYADVHAPYSLVELAASANRCWADGPVQIAIVASSFADLRAKLSALPAGGRPGPGIHLAPEAWERGKVAFLFPGQGSQRAGMLADLFVHFPKLRRLLGREREIMNLIHPGDGYGEAAQADQRRRLADTRVAQPALGMVEMAMAELLASLGLRADMAGGHSYGELVALCYAGAVPSDALFALSKARAEAMLSVVDDDAGTMAVVLAGAADVERVIGSLDGVVIANVNAPSQTVISGSTPAIERAELALQAAGLQTRRIPVGAAFHSPLLAGADAKFGEALAGVALRAPELPVWSNASGEAHAREPEAMRVLLQKQLVAPVQFEPQVRDMYRAGARVFVEVGPGQVLSGLVDSILEGQPHCAVPTDRAGANGIEALLQALAVLSVHGVAVELAALFRERTANEIQLGSDQPPALSVSDWIVDGHRARPAQGTVPETGFKPLNFRLGAPALAASAGTGNPADREAAVMQYLRTVGELVEGQRQVMLRYLGADPVAATQAAAAVSQPAATAAPACEPAGQAEATFAATAPVQPMELLVQILSERTGYPPEMLEPDLDLEADLGIDSIKRTEIIGMLGQRLGLGRGQLAGSALEQLAKQRTLAQIGRWLEANGLLGATGAQEASAPSPSAPDPVPDGAAARDSGERHEGDGAELDRLIPELEVFEPAADAESLAGRCIAIAHGSPALVEALVRELEAQQASALTAADVTTLAGPLDGLVYLEALADECADPAKGLLSAGQHALELGATTLLAVTAFGGSLGVASEGAQLGAGGLAGLLKSIAKERAGVRAMCVDVDFSAQPSELARQLVAELMRRTPESEVGLREGRSQRFHLVARRRSATPALSLDRDAVLLLTGGGRGITAEIARALAHRVGCRLELVGTTAPPATPEPAEIAACSDLPALRKAIAAAHGGALGAAEIDRRCRRILAQRELAATLRKLAAAGSEVHYHQADIRDEAAVARVIDDIYERRGRLDGVVHGAGILEDKLLEDKSSESFARVYDTKVVGARALLANLRPDTRVVAFCSSVSSVFGNRGQTDYAAANDYLDKLALQLDGKQGRRVLSINWGPWSGVGMVSGALERTYRRRGIGLIEPQQGATEFVEELLCGREPQVVLMAPAPKPEHV